MTGTHLAYSLHSVYTYLKSTSCVLTYSLSAVYLHINHLQYTYIQCTLQPVLLLYLQIIYLGLGDTLHLQTNSDYFTGELRYLTFCATLTAFDYCILDDSCDIL